MNKPEIIHTLAKSEDGSIQITFSIPFSIVSETRDLVVNELGKELEIPGFRKGKAPKDMVLSKIPQNTLFEKILLKVIPEALSKVLNKEKIKPAIYPKLELVRANENEDWQVRAETCELPEISLGDYKKEIKGHYKAKSIWTPKAAVGKDEEKEQELIKILLSYANFSIPKLLIEEEVNHRLSNLLARIEKLGLSLESYLTSIGKTAESLREEYKSQSQDALKLELILTKIAQLENIKVTEADIEKAYKISSSTQGNEDNSDPAYQKRIIESILKRRAVVDSLVSLM